MEIRGGSEHPIELPTTPTFRVKADTRFGLGEDLIFTTFEERLAWLRFLYFLESP
jgi:hypothetical protein